jgi:hypothetical protein
MDSIEAPIRWRKSNLTDGKWPRSKNSVQLLALKEERETFLSLLQTDEIRKNWLIEKNGTEGSRKKPQDFA